MLHGKALRIHLTRSANCHQMYPLIMVFKNAGRSYLFVAVLILTITDTCENITTVTPSSQGESNYPPILASIFFACCTVFVFVFVFFFLLLLGFSCYSIRTHKTEKEKTYFVDGQKLCLVNP